MKLKRHLPLGRKVMINLDSILKSRDITLPTKVHLVKALVCPVVMYGCESWTVKGAVSGATLGITDKMEARPLPPFLISRHSPGIKELGLVILTCFFLSLAELTEKNIKVLIVLERSMRRHKVFCSCAQRIIHKVSHWHLFKDFYKGVFQGEHTGLSLRPLEGLLSEAYLWRKCLWQKSLLNLGLRNN